MFYAFGNPIRLRTCRLCSAWSYKYIMLRDWWFGFFFENTYIFEVFWLIDLIEGKLLKYTFTQMVTYAIIWIMFVKMQPKIIRKQIWVLPIFSYIFESQELHCMDGDGTRASWINLKCSCVPLFIHMLWNLIAKSQGGQVSPGLWNRGYKSIWTTTVDLLNLRLALKQGQAFCW